MLAMQEGTLGHRFCRLRAAAPPAVGRGGAAGRRQIAHSFEHTQGIQMLNALDHLISCRGSWWAIGRKWRGLSAGKSRRALCGCVAANSNTRDT